MDTNWEGAGGYGNFVLYRMCEEQLFHTDAHIVSSKLLTIGRVYAASPSRGAGKKAEKDERSVARFFDDLAENLCEDSFGLDEMIERARRLGRISNENLKEIVRIHDCFNRRVTSFIKEWREDRDGQRQVHGRISFASKYLHFHAPNAFFIYDSIVCAALKARSAVFHGYRSRGTYSANQLAYARLCEMLLIVAEEHDSDWTPRSIDRALYGY